jgi:hypothetical protein
MHSPTSPQAPYSAVAHVLHPGSIGQPVVIKVVVNTSNDPTKHDVWLTWPASDGIFLHQPSAATTATPTHSTGVTAVHSSSGQLRGYTYAYWFSLDASDYPPGIYEAAYKLVGIFNEFRVFFTVRVC